MHAEAPDDRRRRRTDTGNVELSTDERIAAILRGSPLRRFPAWDAIRNAVREEFVRRSREGRRVDNEDAYALLVADVVKAHVEWSIRPGDVAELTTLLRRHQFGYGALEPYLDLPGLEELYFNRWDRGFLIVDGEKRSLPEQVFHNERELLDFLQAVALENGQEVNLARPVMDARLRDGSRLNATLPPVAVDGADLVIRKHRPRPFRIDDYIRAGTLNEQAASDLDRFVRNGWNIVVSGGTGSGKTSFLNAIGNAFMPESTRVIVIEETHELQIRTADCKYFQTRRDSTAAGDVDNAITIRDLVRDALRKRPDRIIVGEVRGREAYDTLIAWNSGHDGSLLTVHANSALDAISKLEQLARSAGELGEDAIRDLLASSIDIVVHLSRAAGASTRRVTEIVQVCHRFGLAPEALEQLQRLRAQEQVIELRGGLLVLPLYRLNAGTLEKLHEPLTLVREAQSPASAHLIAAWAAESTRQTVPVDTQSWSQAPEPDEASPSPWVESSQLGSEQWPQERTERVSALSWDETPEPPAPETGQWLDHASDVSWLDEAERETGPVEPGSPLPGEPETSGGSFPTWDDYDPSRREQRTGGGQESHERSGSRPPGGRRRRRRPS